MMHTHGCEHGHVGPASSVDRRTGKGALSDEELDTGDGCWNCERGDESARSSSSSSIVDLSVLVDMKCVIPFHSGTTSTVFWDLFRLGVHGNTKIHSEVNLGFSMESIAPEFLF